MKGGREEQRNRGTEEQREQSSLGRQMNEAKKQTRGEAKQRPEKGIIRRRLVWPDSQSCTLQSSTPVHLRSLVSDPSKYAPSINGTRASIQKSMALVIRCTAVLCCGRRRALPLFWLGGMGGGRGRLGGGKTTLFVVEVSMSRERQTLVLGRVLVP